MFIGGIVFGAVDVLSAEGQMPPDAVYQESLTKLPKSEDEVIVYLNSCIDLAVTEKAKLDVNTEFSIGDDSISFGPNGDLLKKSFVFAK